MPDNNYDKDDGVSIWGHAWNGVKTGAGAGALFGGVGAIPGAVAGGLVGLGTGLWENHADNAGLDQYRADMNDPTKVNPNSREGRAQMANLEKKADAIMDKNPKLNADEVVDKATSQQFHNEQAAKQDKDGPSWWDRMF